MHVDHRQYDPCRDLHIRGTIIDPVSLSVNDADSGYVLSVVHIRVPSIEQHCIRSIHKT